MYTSYIHILHVCIYIFVDKLFIEKKSLILSYLVI